MYGLFFTWHGWVGAVFVFTAGAIAIHRLRHGLEQWMIGLGLAGVLFLAAIAGQWASRYEGVVIQSGMISQVSRGSQVTRVPAIRWQAPDGSEHAVRVTREVIERISPGQTVRKRIGRWFPEPADNAREH